VCSGRDLAAIELRVWLALREASATRLAKVEQAAHAEAWTAEQARVWATATKVLSASLVRIFLSLESVEQTGHGVPS